MEVTAPESPKGDSHSSSSHSGLLRRASGWVAPPHPRATRRLSSRTPSRGIFPLSRHHPQRRHKPEKPRFLALAIRNIAPLLRNVLRFGGREFRGNQHLLRCCGSGRGKSFCEASTQVAQTVPAPTEQWARCRHSNQEANHETERAASL